MEERPWWFDRKAYDSSLVSIYWGVPDKAIRIIIKGSNLRARDGRNAIVYNVNIVPMSRKRFLKQIMEITSLENCNDLGKEAFRKIFEWYVKNP